MADLVALIQKLPSLPIMDVEPGLLKPINPSIFEAGNKKRPLFLRSCQFGVWNAIVVNQKGEIIDGRRRWIAARKWNHKSIPCRKLTVDLEWEEIVRLCFFLNRESRRERTVNVPEHIDWFDPIHVSSNSVPERINRAAETLDQRTVEDLALSKLISNRRKEFSANYAEAVESALDTARTISGFCQSFNQPPFPLLTAEHSAKETVHQLSLLSNSHSDSIR